MRTSVGVDQEVCRGGIHYTFNQLMLWIQDSSLKYVASITVCTNVQRYLYYILLNNQARSHDSMLIAFVSQLSYLAAHMIK